MLELQWTTLAAAIIVAAIVGAILSRLLMRTTGQDGQSLRRQLDEIKQQHQAYEINVTEHFSRTTVMIEELNAQYNKIQSHLAQGAEQFVKPEYRLESARTGEASLEDLAPPSAPKPSVEFPRDYAPKNANEEGMLSETYGLKRSEFEEETSKEK